MGFGTPFIDVAFLNNISPDGRILPLTVSRIQFIVLKGRFSELAVVVYVICQKRSRRGLEHGAIRSCVGIFHPCKWRTFLAVVRANSRRTE